MAAVPVERVVSIVERAGLGVRVARLRPIGVAALALAADESEPDGTFDAESSGLPWAAVWIKDLLTWGTLDPAAAYLLARAAVYTRDAAESLASDYYAQASADDDLLDPGPIRRWARELIPRRTRSQRADTQTFPVELLERVAAAAPTEVFRVLPTVRAGTVIWRDPAGSPLARSQRLDGWVQDLPLTMDFILDPQRSEIVAEPYV